MRLAVGLVCAAASGLLAPPPSGASFTIGLGAGSLGLPDNVGRLARLAPDGETKGSILVVWSGTASTGLGFGASYSGYRLTKEYPDTILTLEARWIVSQFSAYFEYRRALGPAPSAPSAAVRLGASIVPVEVEVRAVDSDSLAFDENDEIRVGPYIGVDFRVPLGQTRFAVFAMAAKTFVNSTLLRQEMGVGPLVLGGGLTYVFRHHYERPPAPPPPGSAHPR